MRGRFLDRMACGGVAGGTVVSERGGSEKGRKQNPGQEVIAIFHTRSNCKGRAFAGKEGMKAEGLDLD
jgi:hypothetical protein